MAYTTIPDASDTTVPSGETADWVVEDSTTNASSTVATYTHRTTGTAAAGIGVAIEYTTEDAGGDDQDVAIMRYVLTTATAGAEIGAVRLAIVNAGTVPAAGSEQHRWTPGQYLGPDGTQSLPGVSFTADPDTGIWRSGSNVMEFICGTVRSVIVTSATISVGEGINFSFGGTTGTQFGDNTTDKLSFWAQTPIVQPTSTGQTAGHTAGAGAGVTADSTFTGGTGTKAYTIGDVVRHLKLVGLLAAS